MGNPRNRRLVGWWLVLWGVLLSLVSNHVLFGWQNLWPLVLTVSGLVCLRVYQSRLNFGVVLAGTAAVLLGGFLTMFSSGLLDWGRMADLWPVIPMIFGSSFVVAGAACPPANAGIIVGAFVFALSAASYFYESGLISTRVAAPFLRFWPLVLVVAGFVLMKRDSRVRDEVTSPPSAVGNHPFQSGALSTDIENDILRRIRGAGGAHAASVALVRELKNRFDRFSWVGIYRVHGSTLTLDPAEYMGAAPEHRVIGIDEGLCGAAARERETIVVPDVEADDRYLAGSPRAKSEIVVPILDRDELIGVLDIDSDAIDAFTDEDRRFLEGLVAKASRLIRSESVSAA